MKESIYQEGLRLGWEMSSHHSDLYVVDCPDLRASIKRRGISNVNWFNDLITGKRTADLFGEYTPWWERKVGK